MNTIEQLVEALIARLRMMQSALGVDETCGEAAAALERLTAERDSLKEGLDGWHSRFLDCEVEFARLVDVCHAAKLRLATERDALRADAELKYTAWQSPHNDDLWFENPADCEIIDNFHPPVHVGFEYELTAGSYTTQRYRVVKIADAESDDVLVELIAGEKT